MKKTYETVIVLTPVLLQEQVDEAVAKYRKFLTDSGAIIVHENNWGLRKLAYPIQKKNTGFYFLFEFQAEPTLVAKIEVEYKRDERIMRFLTIALDKHAVAYNERKRKNATQKKQEEAVN
ncbi:MAG: 30S ribosomal protein S6 [Bacteroidetes bacterium]|jgi:small subunit ribosomal protein S6|nr:30S ribosomal protein S6 [Bacteroidota bacterium]MBK9320842.1 30S ribosomal protein S6 [Bacteroidota bacterium]MBK9400995.1 30S ribosomal protein S6 [Bacteroidota bacterium]MBL0097384.1 30S ribosomal protein S6 [Bacteroidota bacterium]